MSRTARRVNIYNKERTQNARALLITVEEYTLAIEAPPDKYDRQSALYGRSRIYFFGSDIPFEHIDEIYISEEMWQEAAACVKSFHALHAATGVLGILFQEEW